MTKRLMTPICLCLVARIDIGYLTKSVTMSFFLAPVQEKSNRQIQPYRGLGLVTDSTN